MSTHWHLSREMYLNPSSLQGSHGNDGFTISKTMGEMGNGPDSLLNEAELAAAAEEKETHSFEIDPSQVLYID